MENMRKTLVGRENLELSAIDAISGGCILNVIKCRSCNNVDISLDISKCNTLQGALGNHFKPEVLDGNNMYILLYIGQGKS